ncbi:hypothetical protein NXS19_000867 [Fusarium pseudograminearum]|nr:hypothetical protein NXS19_000867 [Fusarium pseudograminearum]
MKLRNQCLAARRWSELRLGGLEVGTDTNSSDDLKYDDLDPVSARFEVDEQAEPDNSYKEAHHDGELVLSCLLDIYTNSSRDKRQRQHVRKKVDSRKQRRGTQNTLVVERKPVTTRHEDECVSKANSVRGNAVSCAEEP